MKGLQGVTYPEVPYHLKNPSELRPHEFRAHGFIRTWWRWMPHTVTIYAGDFRDVSAAFHQIKNMRVQRIEKKDGKCAVSREVKW